MFGRQVDKDGQATESKRAAGCSPETWNRKSCACRRAETKQAQEPGTTRQPMGLAAWRREINHAPVVVASSVLVRGSRQDLFRLHAAGITARTTRWRCQATMRGDPCDLHAWRTGYRRLGFA